MFVFLLTTNFRRVLMVYRKRTNIKTTKMRKQKQHLDTLYFIRAKKIDYNIH